MAGTVEDYLSGLPDDVRARVEEVRRVVHQVVPDVELRHPEAALVAGGTLVGDEPE